MKLLAAITTIILLHSCIPVRIPPKIESDKVMLAKKFKRKLPNKNAFIFEDPKEADEFYHYVNTRFNRLHNDVEWNVPFELEGDTFYFNFYEIEKPFKTINLIPFIIDAKLEENDYGPFFENSYVSREGHWFLVITVSDEELNDCLALNYRNRENILKYLRDLKYEYLNTHNYIEAFLKR